MPIHYYILYGLLKAMAFLPLRVLYLFSSLAAFILYRVVRYRRALVRRNLQRCFPEASGKQIRRWERQFYGHLCDTFIEALKLLHISDRQIDRRVEVVNAHLVDESIEQGRSVVLFLGHYGNWEWVTAICRHFHNDAIQGQIYHPLSSKVMDAIMLKIRSRFSSESITMQNTLRRLVEIERDGGKWVIGFIADQRPTRQELKHWTTFLGIDTPYLAGGEAIGSRFNATYLYIDVEPLKRGHYRLTFLPVEPEEAKFSDSNGLESSSASAEFPYTRQYLRMLEDTIRRNPPYWLWSHNRFAASRPKEPISPV